VTPKVVGSACGTFALFVVSVVCFFITFIAVCLPANFYTFARNFEAREQDPFANFVGVAGWVLGLLAGGLVFYLVMRSNSPGGRR
jgi:hypothetical protein